MELQRNGNRTHDLPHTEPLGDWCAEWSQTNMPHTPSTAVKRSARAQYEQV